MALTVNTNITSLTAQRNLNNVSQRLQGNFQRLSSGLRINNASEDASGLAVSERLRGQIRGYGAASRNTQDGISLTQTAEGSLAEVSNILGRLRELAVLSSNGTLSSTDRSSIDDEAQSLITEVGRISDSAEFNGVQLLDGSSTQTAIQIGINSGDQIDVALSDTTTSTLGIDALDFSTTTGASAAIANIESALDDVNTARGSLGAFQNRLQSAFNSIQTTRENLSSAESRIRDVDVAAESADLSRNNILQQAAVSVLSQANVQPQLALRLLGG